MLHSLRFLVIATVGIWLLSSCGNDVPYLGPEPERPAIPQYPILAFQDSTDVLSSDAFVLPGEIFIVRIKATKGDSLLEELSIQGNNIELDADRITVNGSPVTSSTIPVLSDDRNGFTWDIGITAQDTASKVIYEFKIEDETGRTDFLDILINSKITPFAPPTIEFLGQSTDEVLAGEPVVFDFSMDAIGSPIKTVTIFQGSELVEPDRIKFGGEPIDSNPILLSDIDSEGFTKSFEIATDSTFGGRQGFSIEFLDSLDNKFYEEVSLNTIRRVFSYSIELPWNKAIELATKKIFPIGITKVMDEDEKSDLKDVSMVEGDWDKTIMATNQSNLRNLADTTAIVFDEVKGEKTIRVEWPSSVDFTNQILVKDTLVQTDINTSVQDTSYTEKYFPLSDEIRVDDLFIARNESYYFLIKVREVNESDRSYLLDIKY